MKKAFNLFTENYETIRQTLREIFIYGCFDSSTSAERQKISGRKYSDELKRIRYFWAKQISARRHGERKINFFPFNRCPDGENYLVRSYQIHTFKPQDFNLYIFLLQILSDSTPQSTMNLILETQTIFFPDNDNTEIFYPMMNRKLEEMKAAGLLVREENPVRYKLAEDIFENFDSEELLQLYRILFLYREILPLSGVGCQFQQTLGDYLKIFRGELDLPESCFWLEDIFYQNILNDENFYRLLVAFEQRRRVEFSLPNRFVTGVIPHQIVFDCQYGRQYLTGEVNGKKFFWRLDNISNVRLLEEFDAEPFDAEPFDAEEFFRHIWNASLPKDEKLPCLVEIDFSVSKEEAHFLKRLEAEKRFGEVKKIGKNHCLFSIELLDPNEIIPWIHSFGRAAKVRLSKQHDLREKLEREWSEALENYFKPEKIFKPVHMGDNLHEKKFFGSNDSNQPEIFSEFRNAFYRAVIFAYNEILINGEPFDRKNLAAYLGKVAFDFDESFSRSDSLIRDIISCGNEIKKFSLFREEDGLLMPTWKGNSQNIPEPPIRFLDTEKRWLKILLDAPLAEKLLGQNLSDKLKLALKNICPFPLEKFLIKNGQRTDGDDFNEPHLSERILLLMTAIEKKIFVRYTQRANNGKIYSSIGLPTKIIYSPYLQKFQIRLFVKNSAEWKFINVSNFTRLELAAQPEKIFSEEIFSEPKAKNFIKLRVFPIRGLNDIERCFLLFSTNRKEAYFDLKDNVWHLKIFYRSFERRTIRRKIFSLGKAVVVDEPEQIRAAVINELKTICKNSNKQ